MLHMSNNQEMWMPFSTCNICDSLPVVLPVSEKILASTETHGTVESFVVFLLCDDAFLFEKKSTPNYKPS